MKRRYIKHESQSLHQDMESLVFGDFGIPILTFPTSKGRFYQWEDFGMIQALDWALEKGLVKIYCVDSVDHKSWYGTNTSPTEQMRWHARYEKYILQEYVPFIEKDCQTPDIPIILAGTSFGAFHAMSFFLRNPKRFRHAICMSGIYDLQTILFPFDCIYKPFNPVTILQEAFNEIRHIELSKHIGPIIYCGQGAFEDKMIESSKAISKQLTQLSIPHIFNLWGHDVEHHWYWWEKQMNDFLHHTFPSLFPG